MDTCIHTHMYIYTCTYIFIYCNETGNLICPQPPLLLPYGKIAESGSEQKWNEIIRAESKKGEIQVVLNIFFFILNNLWTYKLAIQFLKNI